MKKKKLRVLLVIMVQKIKEMIKNCRFSGGQGGRVLRRIIFQSLDPRKEERG